MDENLVKELKEIGLSENEAKVYLASLELGPATAQQIAAKAVVSRPNTYIMIESLKGRGLMSSSPRGKKQLFSACSPKNLEDIIDAQAKSLEQKRIRLPAIMKSVVEGIPSDHELKITMVEDLGGLVFLQRDLVAVAKKCGWIDNVASIPAARKFVSEQSLDPLWKDLGKANVRIRSLTTGTNKLVSASQENWENRTIKHDPFSFKGELTVYGDRVAMLSFSNRIFGVLIRDKNIAETMRTMFEMAWLSTK